MTFPSVMTRCTIFTTLILVFTLPALSRKNLYGNCISKTEETHTFPNTPLAKLNTWLEDDAEYQALIARGCPSDRDNGAVCVELPAIGSGLAQLAARRFLSITDRGPNQDCEDLYAIDPLKYAKAGGKDGKGFPIRHFAPTIVEFSAAATDGALIPKQFLPLRGSDGAPISGLPNTVMDDRPYGPDCQGEPLEYDPSGLDTEDLAVIPGTDFVAIVDEYSPSVVIANFRSGKIIGRHVPRSVATEIANARYPIIGDIPDVFVNRRKNRGFEGIVVDGESMYVIAILQSPMVGENDSLTRNNSIIRCAYFSLDVSDAGIPSLQYSKSFIIEASSPNAYIDPRNAPKDLKYSGAQHLSRDKFIILERARGQVKLFLIDSSMATNLDDTKYATDLSLEAHTNGEFKASQLGIFAAEKTLIWDSAPGVGGSRNFTGDSKQEGFVLDMNKPNEVWMVDDNDFGLGGNGAVRMRKVALGRAPEGATVCELPAHPAAPVINVKPSKAIKLIESSTYRISNEPGAGSAENFDVDEDTLTAFVANDDTRSIDKYNLSTSAVTPMLSYFPGVPFKPTSASVCKSRDMIAVALFNDQDDAAPGRIDILSKDLKLLRMIERSACILPDHVEWSDDCIFLVAACEGEGAEVPGGVLVADFGGPDASLYRGATVANFSGYDRIADILTENGVRLIESKVPSVDLEPEYVTIHGKHAFITVQENNVIAVVDLYESKITELKPIGYIDRSRKGFALDASDMDGVINICRYPSLYGMPQPDTIANYVASDGKTYLVFANEGDAKEEAEEARGEDVTDADELGRIAAPDLKDLVEDEMLLGRLKFSSVMGYNNVTNVQEKLYHFGSRSFSIMSLNGSIVFDSGEWFARIQERLFPAIYNSNAFDDEDLHASQADLFDDRSDDKGMEPESLSLMTKQGVTYAFIGFERPSIIVVFDITHPTAPVFVDATQNHPFNDPADEVFAEGRQGDLDPEGLFASAKSNKLYVSGSVSNTVSVYDIVT